ncbi:MAG: caspase family protein [Anaerolineales bacterium]|jgi:tetratricopeptide (TPR) repeat protein
MDQKYALIIGNSDYQDPVLTKLKAPDDDVSELRRVLNDPNIGGFDNVQVMLNQSEAQARRTISQFFINRKRDDLLLMYFSGHGVLDDNGRLHLAMRDTERDLLSATAVPADFVSQRMEECRSKRKILVLDCCHSGAFRPGVKGDMPAITADTFQGFGRVIMSASDKTQWAKEGEVVDPDINLSLFTNYLVEGLRTGEADRGGDGLISVDEWFDYARDKVVAQVEKQNPKIWMFDIEGELVIAKNPNPPKGELPPAVIFLINHSLPETRMQGIEQLKTILDGEIPANVTTAYETLQSMQGKDDSLMVRAKASEVLSDFQPAKGGPLPLESNIVEDKQADADRGDQAKPQIEELYLYAVSEFKAGRLDSAKQLLIQIQKIDPGHRDAPRLLSDITRVEKQKEKQERIARLYDQAVGWVHANQWHEALDIETEIRRIEPEFDDSKGIFSLAEKQKRIAHLYELAVGFANAKQWQPALDKMVEIRQLDPGFDDLRGIEVEAEKQKRVADLYEQAGGFAKAKLWSHALDKLAEIEQLDPGFDDPKGIKAAAKLENARGAVKQVNQPSAKTSRLARASLIVGLIVVVGACLFMCILAFLGQIQL